jgi:NADH-quinone oxidoreductase subunit H
MKFAMFFLAEYVNMVIVSAFATTLFLGGWMFPFVGADSPLNNGWWPVLWFFAKTFVLLFGFIWLRGTLPRMRYDQFMKLGWKVLVPANLVWIVVIVAVRAVRNSGGLSSGQILIFGGIVIAIFIAVALLVPEKRVPDDGDEVTLTGGGYPVPPLDLKVPRVPDRTSKKGRRKAVRSQAKAEPAAVGAGKEDSNGNV